MKLHKKRRENTTSLSLRVAGIEVTRPTWELDEQGVYETYSRTFRFTLAGGEVLEVCCAASFEDDIRVRSVKTLKPIERSKPEEPIDWLAPKIYKGKSMHEEEMPQ